MPVGLRVISYWQTSFWKLAKSESKRISSGALSFFTGGSLSCLSGVLLSYQRTWRWYVLMSGMSLFSLEPLCLPFSGSEEMEFVVFQMKFP